MAPKSTVCTLICLDAAGGPVALAVDGIAAGFFIGHGPTGVDCVREGSAGAACLEGQGVAGDGYGQDGSEAGHFGKLMLIKHGVAP